jgi:uncharacterized repeat protein (TIGR03803 family)
MNIKANSNKWSWIQLNKRRAARTSMLLLLLLTLAMTAAHLTAQVFTTLHTFTGGSDGSGPIGGVILSGNTLYGTAQTGGGSSYGAVFKVNTDGTGFRLLESFNGAYDAAYPNFLLLSGNTLYGASGGSGTSSGTLFAVNTNGTGYTNLHTFTTISAPHYTNSDGAEVWGPLILSGNTLYGAASVGGSGASGMVFGVNTNGTGFTALHSFAATSPPFNIQEESTEFPPYTNENGAYPDAGLILSGDILYGTTGCGGSWGWGTVFAVSTNGTGFTNLYSFTGGSDGGFPDAGLVLSGNTLYGAATWGGTNRSGTVFALNTDGTGFTVLHVFTATSVPYSWPPPTTTNSDGAWPFASLMTLSGNTLYGTTWDGGIHGKGTVFAVSADGTGFTNLHSFTGGKDGANPRGQLILSGNTLYGTAEYGGAYSDGTVFSLSFPPQLTIIPSETNLILTWPTNYAGFDYTGYTLESTTNLVSPVWATNSPAPVVVNGQNVVTNTISGTQQFYRLIQ